MQESAAVVLVFLWADAPVALRTEWDSHLRSRRAAWEPAGRMIHVEQLSGPGVRVLM